MKKTVFVGMSGGVDSSVTAVLLLEQGYNVVGLMQTMWTPHSLDTQEKAKAAESRARAVAAKLGIEFVTQDVHLLFDEKVIKPFYSSYDRGLTPNPCMECNRYIKWGAMLDFARSNGGDYLATGHYARLVRNSDGHVSLYRGIDQSKDQAYFLSVMTQAQLQYALLPLGEFSKVEVRKIADRYGFPTAYQRDSQDLCFLEAKDYREYLKSYSDIEFKRGPIIDVTGNQLGMHDGLAFYTIGQRKGLGVFAADPVYVIEKIYEKNALVVGFSESLGKDKMKVVDLNWIEPMDQVESFKSNVKIRFGAKLAPAEISLNQNNEADVKFDYALRDISPGQYAVFYDKDMVIGCGIIQKAYR
jgi:tRNA-specific 2-thiouridylase